jgi:hypothetical protein
MGDNAFFGHAPHFLLWLLVAGIVAACGFMIADVCELEDTSKGIFIATCIIIGLMLATVVVG